jgi:integrase
MAKFTERFIDALKPKAARYEVWESGGFGIRIATSGGKSWVWLYHHNGRPRRLTLGSYPRMGLADAHVKLADARRQLAQGIDPGEIQVRNRKAERVAETVAELVEAYLEKWARPRKRSADEDERQLRKDVLPAWGRRKAKDITRGDVIALLDTIVDRGSPIAANRMLAVIRRMFGWALSRDIVSMSPCVAVKAPAKERRRDRVLSTTEIAALWSALDSTELAISKAIRLALKFQLVTAQRKGEVIAAEWSELDLREGVWTIPPEKSKNGMPHRVPLSPLAHLVLDEVVLIRGAEAGWLFPSPKDKTAPLGDESIDHAMRTHRSVLGTGDATPRDLRRTAASHMTSIGISRLVVSKILNHAEPGVTAVYDRHSYDPEKRAALTAWGARLEQIVGIRQEQSNVVDFATTSAH